MAKLPLFATGNTDGIKNGIEKGLISYPTYVFNLDNDMFGMLLEDDEVHYVVGNNPKQVIFLDELPEVADGSKTALYVVGNIVYTFDGDDFIPSYQNVSDQLLVLANKVDGIDERVETLEAKPCLEFNTFSSFLKVGDSNTLYLARDTNILYTWDEETASYDPVTGNGVKWTDGIKETETTVTTVIITDNIDAVSIADCQMVYSKNDRKIALDFDGTRRFYNQIEILETEAERQALESPTSGVVYFVEGTCVLWYYTTKWNQLTSTPESYLFIGTVYPVVGVEGTLYVNKDSQKISVWDAETSGYLDVANATSSIALEDINKLFY